MNIYLIKDPKKVHQKQNHLHVVAFHRAISTVQGPGTLAWPSSHPYVLVLRDIAKYKKHLFSELCTGLIAECPGASFTFLFKKKEIKLFLWGVGWDLLK